MPATNSVSQLIPGSNSSPFEDVHEDALSLCHEWASAAVAERLHIFNFLFLMCIRQSICHTWAHSHIFLLLAHTKKSMHLSRTNLKTDLCVAFSSAAAFTLLTMISGFLSILQDLSWIVAHHRPLCNQITRSLTVTRYVLSTCRCECDWDWNVEWMNLVQQRLVAFTFAKSWFVVGGTDNSTNQNRHGAVCWTKLLSVKGYRVLRQVPPLW